jgi:hypothetical protein
MLCTYFITHVFQTYSYQHETLNNRFKLRFKAGTNKHSDLPVDKGALGVHQVELVVEAGPGLGDGGGVREHADAPRHLSQIATGHNGRWLVVDSDLEARRAPVHELDGPLGLDVGDGGVHVLGHHVAAVEHAARHVLPWPETKSVENKILCEKRHR